MNFNAHQKPNVKDCGERPVGKNSWERSDVNDVNII